MNGFEAARQIRRLEKTHRAVLSGLVRQARLPVIIAALIGLQSPEVQEEVFRSGIDTFLTKPIKRLDLYTVLQRVNDSQ
jgi:CheY-like chemotaxis protein